MRGKEAAANKVAPMKLIEEYNPHPDLQEMEREVHP